MKTKEEIAEKAVLYKHSGCNCAQAVVKALSEAEGIADEQMLKQTAGFAVGMGTMETTCGALVGANMIAGIKTEGKGTIMKSKELFQQFYERCGASICKDLKGRDTGVVICECDNCVRNAVYAYSEIVGEK